MSERETCKFYAEGKNSKLMLEKLKINKKIFKIILKSYELVSDTKV